jgi:hypothetical protein
LHRERGSADPNPVCVTKTQLAALLSQSASADIANPSPAGSGSDFANSTPGSDASSTTPGTPPVIQINGDNPAIIQVGTTYTDLGAQITGPQQDLNLGIATYVNGTQMSPIQVDTSAAASDTISYVVTDTVGLTSTSTRTIIIEAPSIIPTDNATTTATTTAQ